MKTAVFLAFFAAIATLAIDQAAGLKCYRCDSQVETSDQACTLGLPSVESQTCAEDEQCYFAVYDLVKLDRNKKVSATVRSCGRQLGGCATEHLRMVNKYGQPYTVTQNSCTPCATDLCNGADHGASSARTGGGQGGGAAHALPPLALLPILFILASKLL